MAYPWLKPTVEYWLGVNDIASNHYRMAGKVVTGNLVVYRVVIEDIVNKHASSITKIHELRAALAEYKPVAGFVDTYGAAITVARDNGWNRTTTDRSNLAILWNQIAVVVYNRLGDAASISNVNNRKQYLQTNIINEMKSIGL